MKLILFYCSKNSITMSSLDGKKEMYQNKPSSTFLSKSRAPYSYVKPDEAPPVALYRPSYAAVD